MTVDKLTDEAMSDMEMDHEWVW